MTVPSTSMVSRGSFSLAMASVTRSWLSCTRGRRCSWAVQPVAHRPGRRHLRQATEPRHERVAGEVLQVLETPGARVEEREDQQAEARAAVISAQRRARLTQPGGQREPLHVASQQFEAAERRELLRDELDRKISLDHPSQGVYAQARQKGLLSRGMDVGTSSLSIAQEVLLIHTDRYLRPHLFSDWG